MKIRKSIECWVITDDLEQVLLLTMPEKPGKRPEFDQPITGGIEGDETPALGCVRELFEETGLKIDINGLNLVKDQVIVPIDDELTVHKTLFYIKRSHFIPVLSPSEHIGYKWVPFGDVEKHLYYKSNKDTWELVKSLLK